jgi:hypothetical protein
MMRMDLTLRLAVMAPKKDATWIVFPNPCNETKQAKKGRRKQNMLRITLYFTRG